MHVDIALPLVGLIRRYSSRGYADRETLAVRQLRVSNIKVVPGKRSEPHRWLRGMEAQLRGKESLNRKKPFALRRREEIICWFSDFFPRESTGAISTTWLFFSLPSRSRRRNSHDNISIEGNSSPLHRLHCQLFGSDEPRHGT